MDQAPTSGLTSHVVVSMLSLAVPWGDFLLCSSQQQPFPKEKQKQKVRLDQLEQSDRSLYI